MENLFIGVDISKDTFDVCIITEDHQVIKKDLVFENTSKGIKIFLAEIEKLHNQGLWVCSVTVSSFITEGRQSRPSFFPKAHGP